MNPNKIPQNRVDPMMRKKMEQAGAAKEARDQAEAYDSLFANQKLELNDGTVVEIPPHPDFGMLDDDRMEDYEDLLLRVDTLYDREPDIFIPEQEIDGVVMPAETKRGDLLRPYRIGGERVKPSHSVAVVIAALGEDGYARIKAGGRCAADVWRVWGRQGLEIQQRRFQGSQTNGSTVDLASVSSSDR